MSQFTQIDAVGTLFTSGLGLLSDGLKQGDLDIHIFFKSCVSNIYIDLPYTIPIDQIFKSVP